MSFQENSSIEKQKCNNVVMHRQINRSQSTILPIKQNQTPTFKTTQQ